MSALIRALDPNDLPRGFRAGQESLLKYLELDQLAITM